MARSCRSATCIYLTPDNKGEPCEISRVVALLDADAAGKHIEVQWFWRPEHITMPSTTRFDAREIFISDTFDTCPIDSFERRITVLQTRESDAVPSEALRAPHAFFYRRLYDPREAKFSRDHTMAARSSQAYSMTYAEASLEARTLVAGFLTSRVPATDVLGRPAAANAAVMCSVDLLTHVIVLGCQSIGLLNSPHFITGLRRVGVLWRDVIDDLGDELWRQAANDHSLVQQVSSDSRVTSGRMAFHHCLLAFARHLQSARQSLPDQRSPRPQHCPCQSGSSTRCRAPAEIASHCSRTMPGSWS